MSGPAKVCSVCGTSYRGLFILHSTTKGHQRRAHPIGKSTWSKSKERGRAAGRVQRYDWGSDQLKDNRYRRRPPLDGMEKKVKVREYFRGRAHRRSSYGYVPEPHYLRPLRKG